MSSPSRKAALLFALGLLLALLLPSSNLSRLDGVPLATPVEAIALLLLAPMVMWREVREAAWALLQRLPAGRALAGFMLGVALAAKAVLFVAGPMQGWGGCYRAGVAPVGSYRGNVVAPQCERSFDNPFFRGQVTRYDRAIGFGDDSWNLGFLNSGRFDFYDWEPDTLLRTRLPFEADWSDRVETPSASLVQVAYVGEGELQVDGRSVPLEPSYAEAALKEIPLAAGSSTITLKYRFDDGSRSGQDPDTWGPRAMLRVTGFAHGGQPVLLTPVVSARWASIALAADLVLGLLVLACALGLAMRAGRELPIVVVMTGAAVGLCLLPPSRVDYVQRAFAGLPLLQLGFAALAMLLLVAKVRARRMSTLVTYMALGVLAIAIMREAYPSWDYVSLRSAGNDGLAAESQARSILQTGSLQGEEPVFYHQPLYRYVKFAEHELFGDGDVLYGSIVLLVALGGAFFALDRLRPQGMRGARSLVWLVSAASLLGLTGYYMARFVRDGMAEYPTWIAMLWAFPLLFAPARQRDLIWGALLLGLASITRTNQLPGNGLVLLAALALHNSTRWGTWVAPLLVFGIVSLLPLGHNLAYGGAFVLTTTSAGVAGNLTLGPHEWLGMLRGDAQAWSTLLSQLRLLSFSVPLDDWQAPVGMFAHLLLAAWLLLIALGVRRGWRRLHVVLLLPLPYFLTHLVFVVVTYYPRHVIMAVVVTALGVLAASGLGLHEPPELAPRDGAPRTQERAAGMG